MRVFGIDITRNGHRDPLELETERKLQATRTNRQRPPRGGALGADDPHLMAGATAYAGAYDENPILSGSNRWPVYEEMRKSDATVKANLWVYKLPIKSAVWDFDSVSDDPADRLVAEACRWQFGIGGQEGRLDRSGRLDKSWEEQLADDLLMLDFGCHFEEIVWGSDLETVDFDGAAETLRPIVRLAPRFARSIESVSWNQDGTIVEVRQNVPGASPIPGVKLEHHALEREGRDWAGTALLRPMYGPWRLKKGLMVGAAIGWDRWAAGIPKVRHPSGGDAMVRQAQQMGRNMRTHEHGYVTLEGPPPDVGQEGWDVELLNVQGALADPTAMLKWYDEQIAAAAIAMVTKLGTTETGARAVGEVLADPLYLGIQAVAKQIAAERRRRAVREFVAHNFGPDVPTPRLMVSKIQAHNLALLAAAASNLAASVPGFDFADRETQAWFREIMGAPGLPADEPGELAQLEGAGLGL